MGGAKEKMEKVEQEEEGGERVGEMEEEGRWGRVWEEESVGGEVGGGRSWVENYGCCCCLGCRRVNCTQIKDCAFIFACK